MTDPRILAGTHKLCTGSSGCQEIKLMSNFSNDKSKKDGKRNRCKQCQRKYNETHRSKRREVDRKYRNKPENRYKKYKASAESRGFEWDVSFPEFMRFWKKDCVHCGSSIETIGLDRVDSSLGYVDGNMEPCCSTCNQMKSDRSMEDWYNHMEKIRKHAGGFVGKLRRKI